MCSTSSFIIEWLNLLGRISSLPFFLCSACVVRKPHGLLHNSDLVTLLGSGIGESDVGCLTFIGLTNNMWRTPEHTRTHSLYRFFLSRSQHEFESWAKTSAGDKYKLNTSISLFVRCGRRRSERRSVHNVIIERWILGLLEFYWFRFLAKLVATARDRETERGSRKGLHVQCGGTK